MEDCAQQEQYHKQQKAVQCENVFNVCVFELDDFEHGWTQAISYNNKIYPGRGAGNRPWIRPLNFPFRSGRTWM